MVEAYTREKIIEDDFRVMLQIYNTSNKKKEPMTLYKLLKVLDGRIDKNRISQALDRLFDEGILSAKFSKVNNKWARIYYITGEAESFVENIYQKVVKL